jgi:hypothetical protein
LYYGARYYDPQLGTFLSPDTLVPDPSRVAAYNRYAYAYNNPLKYNDPSGHRPGLCCITGLPHFYSDALSQVVQTTSAVLSSGEAQAVGQYFSFAWCTMTACDLVQRLEEAHHSAIATYVDPHLPAGVIQARHTINEVMATPGLADAMLGTIQMPLPGMGAGDDMLARLPIRPVDTGPTSGILVANGAEIPLISGYDGPAAKIPLNTPGFNGFTRGHVEGHAAAIMRQESIEEATLYVNNVPCVFARVGCDVNLPKMLPQYAKLHVIGPDGFQKTYVGLPD